MAAVDQSILGQAPSGKVPCLIDQGNIVWDSLSIAEYLAEIHSNVWPKNKQQRSWARCAAAEMHSGFSHLREICGMNIGIRISLHEINQRLKSDLARINELWTEGLTRFGGPFLAGEEFSAVDAFFAPVIFRVQTFGLELNSKAFAYYQHMLGLQGMQQWQSMALAELFRDPIHDMEVEKYGVIDKDLRSI